MGSPGYFDRFFAGAVCGGCALSYWREVPGTFLRVVLLQCQRVGEALADMWPQLLQLVLELAEPLIAGHESAGHQTQSFVDSVGSQYAASR